MLFSVRCLLRGVWCWLLLVALCFLFGESCLLFARGFLIV